MFWRSVFIAAAFCAAFGVSQAEAAVSCTDADWGALGYEDGDTRGTTADARSRLGERMDACEAGSLVDATAYEVGFLEGLTQFCQPARAFRMARSGVTYSGYCPVELSEAFARAYGDGLRVHALEHRATEMRSARRDAQWGEYNERDRINQTMVNRSRDMIANTSALSETSLSEALFQNGRRGYADLMREQDARRRAAEDTREAVSRDLPGVERELAALRAEIGDRYGEW